MTIHFKYHSSVTVDDRSGQDVWKWCHKGKFLVILIIFPNIKIKFQVVDKSRYNNINDAVNFMRNTPFDITIISGENEEIQSNK